mmetsp:Transcript_7209/g.44861  ORF Transcript_7209/g.44861 Transcript_7209/m.44861 type:complete len:271 (-) Transcript_7209:3349-4161(-)
MASLEKRCDAWLSIRRLFRVRSGRLEDLLPPLVHQPSCIACDVHVGMVAKPLHVGGDHGLFQRALADDEGGKVPQRFQQLLYAARFAFQHLLAPPHLFFAVTECAFSTQDHHVLQVRDDPRHPSVSRDTFASFATSVPASALTLHSAIFFCFWCPSSRRSCGCSCRVTYRSIRTARARSSVSAVDVDGRFCTSHVQERTERKGMVADVETTVEANGTNRAMVDAAMDDEDYKSLTLLEVDAPMSPNTGTLGKISSRFFLARLNMPNRALR